MLKQFTFYELYYLAIKGESDEIAGKILNEICRFEFTDEEPNTIEDDRLDSIFCTFEELLFRVKEIEEQGKIPKSFNLKMKHFLFTNTLYRSMKSLNEAERGNLLKAIGGYLFDGQEPEKLKPNIENKFLLLKEGLLLSARRQRSGKQGGQWKNKDKIFDS